MIFLSHGAFLMQTWCFVLVPYTLSNPGYVWYVMFWLCLLVGQYCLTLYLLNSFLCCHIIVIASDLWDIIISFNTSLQKQALPAVRLVLYLALCVVGRSEFPLWGPLTLTQRQRVTQSLPNTHTPCTAQSRRCSRPRESKRSQEKNRELLYRPEREESEWDGEREKEKEKEKPSG